MPINSSDIKVPAPHDWRTTDADEINKRRLRAREESFAIVNRDARHPIFSNFHVESRSGMTYSVEIRDVGRRQFGCDCVDFRINGLGTCKHVEAVLLHLQGRFRRLFEAAAKGASNRWDVLPDPAQGTLRLAGDPGTWPVVLQEWFDRDGLSKTESPEAAIEPLQKLATTRLPSLRLSQEIEPWLKERQRAAESKRLRREYEMNVQHGEWPPQETLSPLFPYQREGMLHLAFTERALLADEMGLGKTIQAIAACALLHRLGKARRVLVVTPASLKTEWEDQIQRFTPLPYQLVFGPRFRRLAAYQNAPFFTLTNYEQMVSDALEVNQRLQPDIVILDEAQRIKNWSTKTAQAVKRLRSRYAFVLTGTPIENRIDEIHSLMDFLNPSVLGPLFRFNRDFYELDERGRPKGYLQLNQLHARIAPHLLRRRKADVETELPERTDRNHFVPLSREQQNSYADHEAVVARLANAAKRWPLTQQEQDRLMRHLAMMRMVCDTNYILDPDDRVCPKLEELEKILEECRENPEVKVLVFSEWERMLELVRELCERLDLGYAWHTGRVPQRRRRAEILAFKSDPQCRVFLSTESGGTGLNLQNASVVINCDLPWNPARLEQRIARAWRKNQSRPVTVINLVAENTLEHRMLDTLAAKQALADVVLELRGDLTKIQIRTGRQNFLARLQQLMAPLPAATPAPPKDRRAPLPADRSLGFSQRALEQVGHALLRCEERFPQTGAHSVLFVVVDREASQWRARLSALHQEFFGPDHSDPLAPVQLEVVDRATDEALERLTAAGLIAPLVRARRPLYPSPKEALQPLTPQELEKVSGYRGQAVRKLKMATLLGQGDLPEETRAALLEALLALAKALAVEQRLPEPSDLDLVCTPPLSLCWQDGLASLRSFLANSAQPWPPIVDLLNRFLAAPAKPTAG